MATPRRRAWIGNAALLLVSLTVSCGAGEVYLRYYRPQPLEASIVWPDGTMRHRPSFRFRYTRNDFSNIVSYNSIGMRGPDVPPQKTPGVPRLLVMGDSYVEGKHVADDEVLTAVIRRRAAAQGVPLEVINLGVAGFGQGRELFLWEGLGQSLDSDIVVLCFYLNDVRNNLEREFFTVENDELVLLSEPGNPKRWGPYSFRKLLAAHSHLYILFKLAKEQWKSSEMEIEEAGRPGEAFSWTDSGESQQGWRVTLALLGEFRKRVEATGAAFVLAVIPTRYQVDTTYWEEFTELAGLPPGVYDRRAPEDRLRAWAEETGTPFIGLFDEFHARNIDNSFYYRIDGHWNPAGHALAAELILEGLRRGSFLP